MLRDTLSLRIGQVKRFLVESRDLQDVDQLSILLTKLSSQDIAGYPDKLCELDGVREASIVKRMSDNNANASRE